MKAKPSSAATDGLNDTGLLMMNPLTVHIFTADGMTTQLLDMCITTGSPSEDTFCKIDETLQKFGISWDKCISVGADNTSVNLGQRKSVMTTVLERMQLSSSMAALVTSYITLLAKLRMHTSQQTLMLKISVKTFSTGSTSQQRGSCNLKNFAASVIRRMQR